MPKITAKAYNYDNKFSNIFLLPKNIRKTIKDYKPDFIIIIQVSTSGFSTILENKEKIPTLVIALGSDVLIISEKGFFYKQMALIRKRKEG